LSVRGPRAIELGALPRREVDHVGAVRAHREDVLEIVEHDASAEVGDVDRLPD
jgi:hypothetical protein